MYDSETSWKIGLLLLALIISIIASYTMFNFTGNLQRKDNHFRVFWLSGGAFVFGIGMWVKQFLTTLAWDQTIVFTWAAVVSLLFTIFFSSMAFVMLAFQNTIRYRLAAGSFILAFAVAFMSYFGELGETVSEIRTVTVYVVLGVLLLFSGIYAALRLSEWPGERNKWLASLTLGMAVFVESQISKQAMLLQYRDSAMYASADRLQEDIYRLSIIIGIGMLLILTSTLFTWYIDKRMNHMDERYKLLVENSLDTIAIFKKDKWVFVNEAGLRMFDASEPEELLGSSIFEYLLPEDHDRVRERMHNLAMTGNSGPLEQEWVTLKGRTLNTEIVELMTSIENEPALQIIIRDISERKKNEELLINSEKLYVAGQLAAGIAHEIRNPLTSLKGFLQLLSSGRKNNGTYYDIMKSELTRIENIVSEMLMLSKPQVYELSYHDTRHVMRETVTLLETQAILHSIQIESDFGPDPLWIYGVESQIKQVFINVIKNAIEAMTDGGAIRVHMKRIDNSVRIRIMDEGPGIEDSQLAKMGQPFYTTKDKGTGLGLMVSYKIVDNHQGKIQVYSQLGSGTTFEIMLPFRYPDTAPVKTG